MDIKCIYIINSIHGIEMSCWCLYRNIRFASMPGLTIIFDWKSMIFQVFYTKAVLALMTSTIRISIERNENKSAFEWAMTTFDKIWQYFLFKCKRNFIFSKKILILSLCTSSFLYRVMNWRLLNSIIFASNHIFETVFCYEQSIFHRQLFR